LPLQSPLLPASATIELLKCVSPSPLLIPDNEAMLSPPRALALGAMRFPAIVEFAMLTPPMLAIPPVKASGWPAEAGSAVFWTIELSMSARIDPDELTTMPPTPAPTLRAIRLARMMTAPLLIARPVPALSTIATRSSVRGEALAT
jgi:hypothetical protein